MWYQACHAALFLFPVFILSGTSNAQDSLPVSLSLAGFHGDEVPISSCCVSNPCDAMTCDGMPCNDASHPCCGRKICESRFKLTEFNIYPTFSYLNDKAASYNEFEFASITNLGWLEMENRTVMNVSDLPSTIALGPTNPGGDPTSVDVRAQGFGDVLFGFFFSPRGGPMSRRHTLVWGRY